MTSEANEHEVVPTNATRIESPPQAVAMPDVSFGDTEMPMQLQVPRLVLNSGRSKSKQAGPEGTFSLSGVVHKTLDLAFVTYTHVHEYHNKDYNDRSPGAPRIICASWNGTTGAYGCNDRLEMENPDAYRDRQCGVLEGGKITRTCPRYTAWDCRPQWLALVLTRTENSDAWMPAIWKVSGKGVKPTEKAYKMAAMNEQASGGTRRKWCYYSSVSVIKDDGICVPAFEPLREISHEDLPLVANFVAKSAKDLWHGELANRERWARECATQAEVDRRQDARDAERAGQQAPQAQSSPPQAADDVDMSNIPF